MRRGWAVLTAYRVRGSAGLSVFPGRHLRVRCVVHALHGRRTSAGWAALLTEGPLQHCAARLPRYNIAPQACAGCGALLVDGAGGGLDGPIPAARGRARVLPNAMPSFRTFGATDALPLFVHCNP